MKHVLFVCSQNWLRSPTAEEVFRHEPGWETRSAGTDFDAEAPITAEIIEWADVIVVMQDHHRLDLEERFAWELQGKSLVVLDIPDEYDRMDPELIEKLHATASRWKDEPKEAA